MSMSISIFLCLLICFKFKILNIKSSKVKNDKRIGKTVYHSYPKDWWPFTPTTNEIVSLKVTKTIPHGSLILSYKTGSNDFIKIYDIKPTKFVDFSKSKAYKRLWQRTHRGLHWLPPKPT